MGLYTQGPSREPEDHSTTMDCGWKHVLNSLGAELDCPLIWRKTLDIGFCLSVAEDKIGPFVWLGGQRWSMENQEENPLNFTSSRKFTTEPHAPVQVSGNSFFNIPQEPHFCGNSGRLRTLHHIKVAWPLRTKENWKLSHLSDGSINQVYVIKSQWKLFSVSIFFYFLFTLLFWSVIAM